MEGMIAKSRNTVNDEMAEHEQDRQLLLLDIADDLANELNKESRDHFESLKKDVGLIAQPFKKVAEDLINEWDANCADPDATSNLH